MDDEQAWLDCHPDDLWVYDKLILSKKLGYTCGPTGVDVPKPDYYVVRPITNIMGMGIGAGVFWLDGETDLLPMGHFWCKWITGRHLSVDYLCGKQTLCVEGFRNDDKYDLYRWNKWERVDDVVPFPDILYSLNKDYRFINCEFIDGQLIEVHLRHNPDFQNDEQVLHVVWEGQDTTPPEGMEFVESRDYKRVGFFKPV